MAPGKPADPMASRPQELLEGQRIRIELLLKNIEDIQGTIRFLDTKATIGVGALSILATRSISLLNGHLLLGHLRSYPPLFLWTLIGIGFILAFKCIFPFFNPSNHVALDSDQNLKFFMSGYARQHWMRFVSDEGKYSFFAESQTQFVNALNEADLNAIMRVLTGEVLKLSFIRQLKNDRLIAFAHILAIAFVVFVVISTFQLAMA